MRQKLVKGRYYFCYVHVACALCDKILQDAKSCRTLLSSRKQKIHYMELYNPYIAKQSISRILAFADLCTSS